ncbi:DUF1737 domain-containing protein [Nioella nitratireducens]|uniref:DUF1737 domain-containing protein n=1 Tax=Nioella nitratireducens TaxID=1287720 RepID=UPI0008FD6003|nr:DUF1737 domain-containing protein [Nioella nitratireducens]
MRLYRLLTGKRSSVFGHTVTAALKAGWSLRGDPSYAFHAAAGVMLCAHAVVKVAPGPYSPDPKLGDQ